MTTIKFFWAEDAPKTVEVEPERVQEYLEALRSLPGVVKAEVAA